MSLTCWLFGPPLAASPTAATVNDPPGADGVPARGMNVAGFTGTCVIPLENVKPTAVDDAWYPSLRIGVA